MILLSRTEVNKFFHLIDSHSYEEALPYGQSLLKKDPFDGAGIRYGVLSVCAVLGKSRIALNTAKKIVEPLIDDETKKKWDKKFSTNKEARDTAWLLEAEPVLVYLLSMAYWKENKFDKAKETIAAMLEAERIAADPSVKGYSDVDELLAELNS